MKKIKTNDEKWLEKALKGYINQEKMIIKDNAKIGLVDKDLQSGINAIKAAKDKGSYSWKEIVGILTGLGFSSAGIYIIYLAIIDPEPTSKLLFLIAGGILITLTGGIILLSALGNKYQVEFSFWDKTKMVLKPID